MARRLRAGPGFGDIVEVTFQGRPIRMDPAGGSDLIARQVAAGHYEDPLPAILCACVARRPGLFLDVGANNGIYSIMAAGVGRGVAVRAFEPYPPVLRILRRNIALNRLQRRVAIEPIALGAEEATLMLHVPSDAHGLLETSCSLEADFQPTVATTPVSVRRLDDVIGAGVPTVMKVDIEGHEPKFMQGARRTIETHRPIVFYEMLGNALERERQVTAFKRSVGYVDFRLRPDVAILADEVVFDGAAWNHALIPQERQAEFMEIAVGAGLRVET